MTPKNDTQNDAAGAQLARPTAATVPLVTQQSTDCAVLAFLTLLEMCEL
jgi:hypothetical protein